MSIGEIGVLVVIAGGVIAALLKIRKAIRELGRSVFAIEAELKSMNARAASAEAASNESPAKPIERHDSDLQAIEAAISNFEKMKRIDLTKP